MDRLKLENKIEKVIIVGVGLKSTSLQTIKEDLSELSELVDAAGGEIVASTTQTVKAWSPATLIGKGKIKEIQTTIEETNADLVVFDHTLSGVQSRNLEKELQRPILDRNQLILDIFAQRAQTFEGKLQVELAQMLDQMPRMIGAWHGSLSRLGGGIGTRGPGEKAIEIDRRRAREKIQKIRKQLQEVKRQRQLQRSSRQKKRIPSFALIGYTNAGKSTLLNQLTGADIFTKDQVFATLDPTTRQIFLNDSTQGLITDTVGFIRKLPTKLIEAFKATLEESGEADILLHVVDLSSSQMEQQMETVEQLIKEFQWDEKPIIHIFNKMDKASPSAPFKIKEHPRVFISCKTQDGLDDLKNLMITEIEKLRTQVEIFVPHSEEHLIYELDRQAHVHRKERSTVGTVCLVSLTDSQLSEWKKYLV